VGPAIGRAFARIDSLRPHTLILDIRNNPGGDATSIIPAAHLLRDTATVGVFLGTRWYARHRGPPTPAQLDSIPVLSNDSASAHGAGLILRGIRDGAVVGRVVPRAPRFDGTVYLLTSERSASASEPLAHLLKTTKRATLIGERTAGKMLTALPHPIGDGWVLVVPEADYYAADGTRLEGRGVEPDVRVKMADASIAAAERIAFPSPYARSLMLGWANMSSRRTAEGERWYREALRLAPDSLAPLNGLTTAYRLDGRWEPAFALWEARLAARPGDLVSLGQIGALAALSGQRLARGEEALRELLRATPPPSRASLLAAHKRLAAILLARGDREGARAEYEAVLRLDPNDAEARAALERSRP
jgi:Flp pilus assembly protein TadD